MSRLGSLGHCTAWCWLATRLLHARDCDCVQERSACGAGQRQRQGQSRQPATKERARNARNNQTEDTHNTKDMETTNLFLLFVSPVCRVCFVGLGVTAPVLSLRRADRRTTTPRAKAGHPERALQKGAFECGREARHHRVWKRTAAARCCNSLPASPAPRLRGFPLRRGAPWPSHSRADAPRQAHYDADMPEKEFDSAGERRGGTEGGGQL